LNLVATEIKAKVIVAHRVMYYAKSILNSFGCLEFRILVGKSNIYIKLNFSVVISTNIVIRTTSFF